MELSGKSRTGNPTPTREAGTLIDSISKATVEKSESVSELALETATEPSESVCIKAAGVMPVVAVTNDQALVTAVVEISCEKNSGALVIEQPRFPLYLPHKLELFLAQNGKAFGVMRDAKNPYAVAVTSKRVKNCIQKYAIESGVSLRKSEFNEVIEYLQAQAEMMGVRKSIWLRVAPIPGGIEIDLGDDEHARVRITAGKVEIIESGSDTMFYRTPSCLPMVRPAAVGNLKMQKKYLNLDYPAFVMLMGWESFTLAHPKQASSKYVILTLRGVEGGGKSAVAKAAAQLIDPRLIDLQIMPSNGKDLAIATQNAHVLCFDNIRSISPAIADLLCVTATGGAIASRQLYTDSEQQVLSLHGALILNGIHAFVSQPDLAQRCLPLYLEPIKADQRKSEVEMQLALQADLPAIQRGLFDLIAQVFLHLPNAKVIRPTRMIEFSKWLAAIEMVYGVPAGMYQDVYCSALNQGQLDALMDNSLAAVVLEFAEIQQDGAWSGTPSELLSLLNFQASQGTQRSRDWPQNAIALSKRLLPLQAGLLTQGVAVELSRGKHRTICIQKASA